MFVASAVAVVLSACAAPGAVLTGIVLDADGRPLRAAEVHAVSPLAPLPFARLPALARLFEQNVGQPVTHASAVTDAEGRFELPALPGGQYRITVAHPDGCEAEVEVEVAADRRQPAEPLILARGAVVEGVVTLAGRSASNALLGIAPLCDGVLDVEGTRYAHADHGGRFRFSCLLPPGHYGIWAQPDEGPFPVLLQYRAVEHVLVIEPGQDRLTHDFQLP
jgi:protocatechuate 3,4-dioxygenase beta subunit